MANMDLDAYKKALEDKSEVPSFAPAVKTQYSRNITIEDWNSIVYSVQGLLSDMSATAEYTIDADVASTYETKSDAGDKYVSLDNKIIALDDRIAPYEKALDLKGKTYALPSSAKSDVDVFSANSTQTDIRSPMGTSSV
ncbi:hypothetical protein, partial [Paratractidigestivibacter sp.]|uniref:hypothetical protein n=1 Tax=Paratractidigestivibacter sp. TaxID=2847316 RepID=UPI002AC94A1C